MSRRALIIGCHGQDGAYLAQHLLKLGYEVYGGARRSSSGGPWRLESLGVREQVIPVCMDVMDEWSVANAIAFARPDEIYNLAAQGHVGDSWALPSYTLAANSLGALNVFLHMGTARVFQASTLSIFGNQECPPSGFDEATRIEPADPYGATKAAGHHWAHVYRKRGKFIACGILGNHESPLRQDSFVTQKIAKGVKRWKETGEPFELHNVTGIRDWGWAPEYVEAMHLMLQQDEPEDYVIATGCAASVLDFVAASAGYEVSWARAVGDGIVKAHRDQVYIERSYLHPADRQLICRLTHWDADRERANRCFGNPTKANERLNWVPMVRWAEIARRMVEAA